MSRFSKEYKAVIISLLSLLVVKLLFSAVVFCTLIHLSVFSTDLAAVYIFPAASNPFGDSSSGFGGGSGSVDAFGMPSFNPNELQRVTAELDDMKVHAYNFIYSSVLWPKYFYFIFLFNQNVLFCKLLPFTLH